MASIGAKKIRKHGDYSYSGNVLHDCYYCMSNFGEYDPPNDILVSFRDYDGMETASLSCSYCQQSAPFADIPSAVVDQWNRQQDALLQFFGDN